MDYETECPLCGNRAWAVTVTQRQADGTSFPAALSYECLGGCHKDFDKMKAFTEGMEEWWNALPV